jgi:hypothetical protein
VAKPSKVDVDAALSQADTLEKVQRHRPKWDDYVAEGIINGKPEPDENGTHRAKVNGHDRVTKMLKMNEEANRLASWHGDNQAESPNRRRRREEREERTARKRHKPRASTIVPEMPWTSAQRRGRGEAA